MDKPTKMCRRCSKTKLLDDFTKNAHTKDRRSSYCRECDRDRHSKKRDENKIRHANGPSATEKKCPRCQIVKAASEFPHNPTTNTGLASYCIPCNDAYSKKMSQRPEALAASRVSNREARRRDPERFFGYRLKKDYNITIDEYNQMLKAQGGVCAICGGTSERRLHVDHDHSCCPRSKSSCGRCVRALLCSACNTGLGHFRDSPALLAKAIDYLNQ